MDTITLDGKKLKEATFYDKKEALQSKGLKLKEVSPGVWKTLKKLKD